MEETAFESGSRLDAEETDDPAIPKRTETLGVPGRRVSWISGKKQLLHEKAVSPFVTETEAPCRGLRFNNAEGFHIEPSLSREKDVHRPHYSEIAAGTQ